MEDGHQYKLKPVPLLGNLDTKQRIHTQDTSFPSDLLQIPAHVKAEGGKICACSLEKPRQGGRSWQGWGIHSGGALMATFFARCVLAGSANGAQSPRRKAGP